MTHETEQALTEAVAKVLYDFEPDDSGTPAWSWEQAVEIDATAVGYYRDMATAAVATVRQFDEQAALNCGHCTPNSDEIACGCQIEERNDE